MRECTNTKKVMFGTKFGENQWRLSIVGGLEIVHNKIFPCYNLHIKLLKSRYIHKAFSVRKSKSSDIQLCETDEEEIC